MSDFKSSTAHLEGSLLSTLISHFWHTCLKKLRFNGTYSAHVGHLQTMNNVMHIKREEENKPVVVTCLGIGEVKELKITQNFSRVYRHHVVIGNEARLVAVVWWSDENF